ncbi:hypothetical protein [Lacticaseibacillus rhamnosus]|uniref:hypothetical protein n=1 Tax=Lacticaseibacillus rhamnosus TaxID=47715 RepID=UPI000ADA58FB|nr:hypothetical protein [Lacticaseibacillus rhamnosus]
MKKRYWIIAIAALAFVGLGGWWYVTASTNTTTSSQLQKSSKSSSKTSKATPSTKKSKDSSIKNSSAGSPAVSVNSKSESKSQAASVVSNQTTSQSSSNSYKPKSVSVSNSQIAMMAYQARGGSEMLKDPNSITYGKDPQGTLFISRNNGESKMIFKIEDNTVKVLSFAQSNLQRSYSVDDLVQRFYQTPSEKQLIDNAVAGANVQ